MAKRRGAPKGGAFERRIAKRLTLWASGRDKPLWYWRTGGSGAQATMTSDFKSRMAGDIMAITPEAMFLTDVTLWELRNRKQMHVLDFVDGSKTRNVNVDMAVWWDEVKEKASKAKRFPIACFHRPGSSHEYLILTLEFVGNIQDHLGHFVPALMSCYIDNMDAVIVDMVKFLKAISAIDFAGIFIDWEKAKEVEQNYCSPVIRKRTRKKLERKK